MNAVVPMKLVLKPGYIIGNNMIYKKEKKGFTLVELLIGMVVFSLAIGIAVNLFAASLRNQRKSIAIQNVQDNGRYLMSFVAKEVRMSEIRTSDGTYAALYMYHPEQGDITYIFTGAPNWQITRNGDAISSDEVQVQGVFYIDGRESGGDDEQPRATIVMKVETTGAKIEERAEINLQTTLSQRKLD